MSSKPLKLNQLRNKYESACCEYAERFAEKQGLEFDYWVSDIVGGVAAFGDYFFTIDNIVFDINSRQPVGLILQWQGDTLANQDKQPVNYYSYAKGLRYDDIVQSI